MGTPIISPNILVIEGLWSDTAAAIRAAGGIPTEVSPWSWNEVEDEIYSGTYQGVVFTGGSDVNPERYDAPERHPQVYGVDDLRDAIELEALDAASHLGLPVLGICRGSQIMAVHAGGKLVQHIGWNHRGSEHWVAATPSAKTFKRACNSRDMRVVSLHHQCVAKPGKGMRVAAIAHDGTPEAIESKDGRCLGVQFHPELNAFENANSFAIFRWLVESGAAYLGGRAPARRFRDIKRRPLALVPSDPVADTMRRVEADDTRRLTPSAQACLPARVPRRAGDPALPSMRAPNRTPTMQEVVDLVADSLARNGRHYIDGKAEEIESVTEPLDICPHCGMLFDHRQDRDDHVYFLHGPGREAPASFEVVCEPIGDFEDRMRERYPELEPPPGSDAWCECTDAGQCDESQADCGIRYGAWSDGYE